MVLVVLLVLGSLGLWAMRRGARGFAERQQQLGLWDAKGPLVETRRGSTQSETGNYGTYGGSMGERLEVIGKERGVVTNDRRPDSVQEAEREAKRRERVRLSSTPLGEQPFVRPGSTPKPRDDSNGSHGHSSSNN